MPHHGVVLCFDPEAEDRLCAVREQVREVSGSTFLIDQGAPPHLTLGIYGGADEHALAQSIESVEGTPLELSFA